MDSYIYDLWLKLKQCFSPAKQIQLLNYFKNAEGVYNAYAHDYFKLGLSDEQIIALSDKNLSRAEAELAKAKELGIGFVRFGDEYYPELLANIDSPPALLYAKGDLTTLKRKATFCIVGSRRPTPYGLSAALGIATNLSQCGMTIVSGCAEGIDSAAHKGALRARGKTIGVMACGLDLNYPAASYEIKEGIVANGVLISEFPFSTPALPVNFRIRNRILSGLSLGVAVIEASERSGALITARYALDQGRDLFALPGNISSNTSRGTNLLIQKEGAALLTGSDEIVSEYIFRFPEYFSQKEEKPQNTAKEQPRELPPKELFDSSLSSEEQKLLSVIGKTPIHIDNICRESGLAPSQVNALLTVLQIKGKVQEQGGRLYKKL